MSYRQIWEEGMVRGLWPKSTGKQNNNTVSNSFCVFYLLFFSSMFTATNPEKAFAARISRMASSAPQTPIFRFSNGMYTLRELLTPFQISQNALMSPGSIASTTNNNNSVSQIPTSSQQTTTTHTPQQIIAPPISNSIAIPTTNLNSNSNSNSNSNPFSPQTPIQR